MPCNEMLGDFDAAIAAGERYLALASDNPFARAVENELAEKGIRVVSEVRIYKRDVVTVQVDMNIKDPRTGYATRAREVVDIPIDELHDMAVKFLAPIDPTKPLSMAEMRKHFHPKAPKDLMDKPLPPMRRKFIEVATIDGYMFNETWEAIPPKESDSNLPEEVDKSKVQEALDLVNKSYQRWLAEQK